MLSRFSRKERRQTLVITGLSVSLQCLVKLWRRLFCELLKNIERQCSHWSQPTQVHEGKALLKGHHLVSQRKLVDVVVLDFSKAFDTVSQSILLDKMSRIQLGKSIIHWMNN